MYSKIRDTKKLAGKRIANLYGDNKSRPQIIFCGNTIEYEKYCNSTESAGCSMGTPWGSKFVVINGSSLSADVISHEWSHIELLERVGWWKVWNDIPQWFNEGLAMMVDHRFAEDTDDYCGKYIQYRIEWILLRKKGQPNIPFSKLTTVKDFVGHDVERNYFVYISSGLEVANWLVHNNGSQALNELLIRLKKGSPFSKEYIHHPNADSNCIN